MFKNLNKYKEFILEKRIGQISSKIEVIFSFDVIKTKHTELRSDFDKRGLDVETIGKISNAEMKEFVSYFRKDISEAIATGEIKDKDQFVIKSLDRELAMAIIADQVETHYWKLVIKTVFRETHEFKLKTGRDQFVIQK